MEQRLLPAIVVALYSLGLGVMPGQDYRSTAMIQSIVDRKGAYIASTSDGLYQANVADKVWHKLAIPFAMPTGGHLAQKKPDSPELVYYTGRGPQWYTIMPIKGSLYVSRDGGRTWTASRLDRQVLEAYIHSEGSIYASVLDSRLAPLSGQKDSDWAFESGDDKVKHYEAEHLVVSNDWGKTWRDITPPLNPRFGLDGIFPDPEDPNIVCVESSEINHTSRSFIYQASDTTYHWKEISLEDWLDKKLPRPDGVFWSVGYFPGCGGGNAMITLDNFFKFPLQRSDKIIPEFPPQYLETEMAAYRFKLHQPMPVVVKTVFLFPEPGFKILDNLSEKIFWGLKIRREGENSFATGPQIDEFYSNIPNHEAKKAAYLNDPRLIKVQVDQTHPYQRVVDLNNIYEFTEPGNYRIAIYHSDELLSGANVGLDTLPVDVVITR